MLRILLFPFSLLYGLITRVRNALYDRGLKPSIRFDLPVIGVGNLTVGGTGKTPFIEYLVELLAGSYKTGIVSRGYGRETKGFRLATMQESAKTIGDEPFQFFRKLKENVTVAVGEERALAIPLLLQEDGDIQVILLDDSFQHRRVRPSLNILLSDFNRPFYDDLLLPAGRLRESVTEARRADIVIVTKCPVKISEEECIDIERKIRTIAPRPVFFTTIRYGNPVPFQRTSGALRENVVLVTGIANARPLVDYVRNRFRLIEHVNHNDHYSYKRSDLSHLAHLIEGRRDVSILTTEKDMVKMDVPGFADLLEGLPLFYVPITVQFLKNEEDFKEMVMEHVRGDDYKNIDEKN